MEELLENLKAVCTNVDFEGCTNLVSGGVLSSLEIISIVTMINDEYDIKLPVTELKPENFESVESIYAMIERIEEN